MDHIDNDERISAYLDGELSADEQSRFEERLAESAELRQLVEELRALRGTLDLLPRHKLEADFADRILRRAEKEMLLSGGGSATGGGGNPSDGAVNRPVVAGQLETARSDAAPMPAGGSASFRSRALRPLVYAAAAIAAAVMIVVFTPPKGKDVPDNRVQSVTTDRFARNGGTSSLVKSLDDAQKGLKRRDDKGDFIANGAPVDQAAAIKQADRDIHEGVRSQTAQDQRAGGQSGKLPSGALTGTATNSLAARGVGAGGGAGKDASATTGVVQTVTQPDPEDIKKQSLGQINGQPHYANSRSGGFTPGPGGDNETTETRKNSLDAVAQQSPTKRARRGEQLDSLSGMVVVKLSASRESVEQTFSPILAQNGIVWKNTSARYAAAPSFDDRATQPYEFKTDQSAPMPFALPAGPPGAGTPSDAAPPVDPTAGQALLKEAGGKSHESAKKQMDSERAAGDKGEGDKVAENKESEVEVVVVEGTADQIRKLVSDVQAAPAFQTASIGAASADFGFYYRMPQEWADGASRQYGALAVDKRAEPSAKAKDVLSDRVAKDEPSPAPGAIESLGTRPAATAKRPAERDEKPNEKADADKLTEVRSKAGVVRSLDDGRDRAPVDKADEIRLANSKFRDVNAGAAKPAEARPGSKPDGAPRDANKSGDRSDMVRKPETAKAIRGGASSRQSAVTEPKDADKSGLQPRVELRSPATPPPGPSGAGATPVPPPPAREAPPQQPLPATPDKGDVKDLKLGSEKLEKAQPQNPIANGPARRKIDESPAEQPADSPVDAIKGPQGGRGPQPAKPAEKQPGRSATETQSFQEQTADLPNAKGGASADGYSRDLSVHSSEVVDGTKKPADGRDKVTGEKSQDQGTREAAPPPVGFAIRMQPIAGKDFDWRGAELKLPEIESFAPPASGVAGHGAAGLKEEPSAPARPGEPPAANAKRGAAAPHDASDERETPVKVVTETVKAPPARMQAIFFFKIVPSPTAAQAAAAAAAPAETVANPASPAKPGADAATAPIPANRPATPPAPADRK